MRIRLLPTLSALPLLPLLAAGLAGCADPIDPDALADRISLQAREVVHQSGGGVAFADSDDSGLKKLADGLNGSSVPAMPAPVPPAMMSAMNGSPMFLAFAGMPSMMTTEEQFDSTADQLRHWLRERVLTHANLESQTDESATYLLAADPTCRPLPQDGDPPGTIPEINTDCADKLTRLIVRVILQADGDGGRLTILVGPNRLHLSQFIIHSDLLAVEVDLEQAYAATQYIDDTLGTEAPMETRYDALEGRIEVALHKDGARKVTGSVSVLRAIHVGTLDAQGARGPEIKLAKSDQTLAVTADGVNQSLTFSVDVGALDVFGDWNPAGGTVPNRDLHVAIGGIHGRSTFTEASDQIVATGVGVGPTTIDVRSSRIFTLGLNPNDQNRFDATVSLDAAGQPQVSVTPRFDLSLGYHLAPVAGEYTDPPPAYTLDETFGYKLDNAGAPAGIASVPSTPTFGGGLKVTAGTLTVSTSAAGTAPVVVPAGRCLVEATEAPAGSHPLLGKLSVVDCPAP